MTALSDNTVTGFGEIAGFQPAPLSLYTIVTLGGLNPRTHDGQPAGRWFDVGWWAPYFLIDFGAGPVITELQHFFIQFENQWTNLRALVPGGMDGFHYQLAPGVTVRFLLTDD